MRRNFPGTRALRTFEAAGRHLNFTRAADELGLTPAAVSYQIKEIEEQLGLALFVRNSRRIQLTPAGALLLEASADALESLRRALGRARKRARGTTDLRLSLGARFASNWLLPRLPEFRAANPSLELTFDISDQVRDFDADAIDIAIRFGSGDYPGMHADRLFGTSVVPVCSPALIESGPPLRHPRDLLQHTLCHVDCKVDGLPWPDWPMWMAAAGIDNFDGSRCIAFSDSSHVVQAVLEGGVVGLAEPALIASELALGRLVKPFDIGVSPGRDYAYHLVYPHAANHDPRIVVFRGWMLQQVAQSMAPLLE